MTIYYLDSTSFTNSGDESIADWDSKGKHTVLLVHAEWCGYCKKTVPEFKNAANQTDSVNFALLEDVDLKKMSKPLPVRGFPSFFLIDKDSGKLSKLEGFPRDTNGMLNAVNNM